MQRIAGCSSPDQQVSSVATSWRNSSTADMPSLALTTTPSTDLFVSHMTIIRTIVSWREMRETTSCSTPSWRTATTSSLGPRSLGVSRTSTPMRTIFWLPMNG